VYHEKSGDVVLRIEKEEAAESSALKNLQETKTTQCSPHKLPIFIAIAYLFCLTLIAAGQKVNSQKSYKVS